MLHVQRKQMGKDQPADGAEQGAGETGGKTVPLVGEHHKHGSKQRCLQEYQQEKAQIDETGQKAKKRQCGAAKQFHQSGAKHVQKGRH